ncbi:MAG: hypothetical protein NTX44_11530 [Ignavibacteriales bacterium]|nr:hypothetical protein [Ignavibacteriales bacterium]
MKTNLAVNNHKYDIVLNPPLQWQPKRKKGMAKFDLDAMIPREDFTVTEKKR